MYEEKIDGYRMVVYKADGEVQLVSRNGRDHTRRFRELAKALSGLKPKSFTLDGEVAVFDRDLMNLADVLTAMSERQPGVAQEGERQLRVATHASTAAPERSAERLDVRRAEVRELRALDVAPDGLDRVELRRIARQALDHQPPALLRQVVAHQATFVSGQSIPDEDYRLPTEVAAEVTEEADQQPIGVAARLGLKEKAGPAPIPAKGQGTGHGQPLPAAAYVRQGRCFAARRPGPADDRLLRDAAFVLEEEPRAAASGVFFSCGQRRVFHSAMACSSRSRARRVGRWSDHPSPRSTRQTCPGWCRMSVSRSISSATRGRVQRSVGKPCARGPVRSARSTVASCAACNCGRRPARPAPFRPSRPCVFQAWNQWWALTRVTPNAFATATCESPRANSRAAFSRRASIAARSRAGVGMLQHAIVPVKSVSLFCETH